MKNIFLISYILAKLSLRNFHDIDGNILNKKEMTALPKTKFHSTLS